ncbi:MAG: hypothetical protein HY706_17575, partial [Candidatus Hydrogenedentes bacterium]|nr:hypothetical protein [Candidatus Hydrogenedentota bacterium]
MLTLLLTIMVARIAYSDPAQDLVAAIQDPSPEVRATAWQHADRAGAAAIVPLSDLVASAEPEIALAAERALETIVHSAGRPDAAAERPAVAAGLVELVDGKYPEPLRRVGVRLSADIATDAEVPAIAALLNEPALAEDACMSLDRIPGDASTQALIASLATAPDEVKIRVATILAHKNASNAIPALAQLAQNGQREVGWVSLEALARLGVPPDQVFPRSRSTSAEDKSRYTNAMVQAAAVLATRGERDAAERLYTTVASFYTASNQACAALVGLAELQSPKLIAHAITQLDAEGVHDVAEMTLAQVQVGEVEKDLAATYTLTNGAKRAAILRILSRRNASQLQVFIERGRHDTSPEARVTAYQLSGLPPSEDDLLLVAVNGSRWARMPALESYLKLAAAKIDAGDATGARKSFENVLRGDFIYIYKAQALAGLERVATVELLPLVTPLMEDPDLAAPAGRAAVAIYASLPDKEQAESRITTIADSTSRPEVMAAATEHLRALGADTRAIAQRRGFITDWKLLGPFPNPDNSAFRKPFFDESRADQLDNIEFEGKAYTWKLFNADNLPAVVNLKSQFDPNNRVAAYGYAEISTDREAPVVFLLGSDDGCEFWLNWKKLHESGGSRNLVVDGERV